MGLNNIFKPIFFTHSQLAGGQRRESKPFKLIKMRYNRLDDFEFIELP